jgi:REP element-mobilizing transposase RayT
MRAKQNSLFDHFEMQDVKKRYARTEHGGLSTKGKRKLERPLNTRMGLHLVLKSDKAVGKLSFLTPKNQKLVRHIVFSKARKFGIRVKDFANAGNHLHLRLKIQSRLNFQRFLKAVTTLIARKITGARRGFKFGRFWQGLAYSRVLTTYAEELRVRGYIQANEIEVANSPAARERYLRVFNAWLRCRSDRTTDSPAPA